MPVIAFSSPKGGAGKTTAATILAMVLVHRHIHKIQGPPSLGQADHRNRRGFIMGLTNGSEPPLYLLSESVH
jgi:Mrp family chromosome partitioning ATPase